MRRTYKFDGLPSNASVAAAVTLLGLRLVPARRRGAIVAASTGATLATAATAWPSLPSAPAARSRHRTRGRAAHRSRGLTS